MQLSSRPYSFLFTDHDFYFKTNPSVFNGKHFLKINRQTSKIQTLDEEIFQKQTKSISAKFYEQFYLIVGIIIVFQEPYLCIVTDCQPVGTFMKDRVHEIRNVKFIPFKHRFLYEAIDQSESERILQGIRQTIVANHFYFCYREDITLTHDKRFNHPQKATQRKYFWNEYMLKIFSRHRAPLCWRIPIMQGYITELHCENNYFSFYYLSVSRRSKYMSGTRFNSRGINLSFNAANFVQTEQIFICHNLLFSHVSLRGSAPIFWEQNGFGAEIKFPKQSNFDNELIIEKHYELLKAEYGGEIVTINLLSKVKSPEKQLKDRFEFYYYKSVKGTYLYFDLNQEMKDKENGQKVIDAFVYANQQHLSGEQNYLCMDRYNNKVFCRQKTIPRINCLDCIDRTNVVMARISQIFLSYVESHINDMTNDPAKKLVLNKEFMRNIVDIWAKIGNRISQIYCGTESVATHLTKKQNNSIFSFFSSSIKSINRYYNANVNDSTKQDCLQFFLGQKQQLSTTNYFQDNITNEIIEETDYCSYEEFGSFMLTWNCNMVDPESLKPKDLDRLFDFHPQDVDIIVVCLQEMVELNSYNVLLGNNETITTIWRKIIWNYLNKMKSSHKKNYVFLTGQDLIGIATFVFVNEPLLDRITEMSWFQIKTGFKGSLGNKGAIMLFLKIDSTPITIISCHLAAGQSKSTERIQDIDYIHHDALKERSKQRFFKNSQFRFFIGDMNFRLEAKNQNVRELLYSIEKQDQQSKLSRTELSMMLRALLDKDEFRLNNQTGALSTYTEAEIYFLPTYKYIKKEKAYDTKRTPSWCDRILYYRKDKLKIKPLKYHDVHIYNSDHRPVAGVYRFLCKNEDSDKKKKLIDLYLRS